MSGVFLVVNLMIAIAIMIVLILVPKFNPALSLVIASIYMGVTCGLGFVNSIETIGTGFGNMMAGIGLPIGFGVILGQLMSDTGAAKVIARTIVLDRMVEQYLEKNANTIVINIACGLDTRCYRMKEKYLRWYNVDLPETMKIRRQFLPETGPIYQIAKSAMDDSYVDDIDYHGENVLVIMEGLTMYLCEKDIRKIFSIIEKSFQKVTVMVETMSPFVVKHVKEKSIEGSNAKFTWGVKNGTELQKIVPNFSILQEVSLVEGMKELMPIYHVIGKIPIVRNISNKIIVLEKRG